MKLQIPRADALAIGSAITAAIALAQETHWEHWVKQLVIIVGGLVLAVVINPLSATSTSTSDQLPVPGATSRPEPPAASSQGQPL